MEEAQQKLLHVDCASTSSAESLECGLPKNVSSNSIESSTNKCKHWAEVAVFIFFTLFGGVSSTLLISTYYNKGGKSVWLVAFVENSGLSLLLPFLIYSSFFKNHRNELDIVIKGKESEPHILLIILNYIGLGVLLAAVYMFNAMGLQYLPASTYSIITATQLGFNALFSSLLNSQKITPAILNCIVLLTASSVICVFQNRSQNSNNDCTTQNFLVGFVFTLAGSATYPLQLCLTQLSVDKVLKSKDFVGIIEMSIFQTLVAAMVLLIGLFASGDWNHLSQEMEGYELGRAWYMIVLLLITISTAVYIVASTGLIFKVSSLFSNAVINLSAPITPVFSVLLLHEMMNGLKVMSLFLALWGFASYIYQQYLDDLKARDEILGDSSGDI